MIYLKEIKSHLKSIILIYIILFILLISTFLKYESYNDLGQMEDLMASFPKIVKAILGFSKFDILTFEGTYSVLFIYISIAIICYSLYIGATLTSKPKSFDVTYILPIKRYKIVINKLLANITILLFINILLFVTTLILSKIINVDIIMIILFSHIMLFIISLFGLAIGTLIGNIKLEINLNTTIALGLGLLIYLLFVLSNFFDNNFLNLISPITNIISTEIYITQTFNYIYAVIIFVISIILSIFGIILFNKKEL